MAFIIIMMLSKDNYNPLDIVNKNVKELPNNEENISLKNHITLLAFFGKNPLQHSVAALNLKELVYDRTKGFKKFQVVVLLPKEAKAEAEQLLKQIKSYEDLRFWHFVYADDADIKSVYNSLKTHEPLSASLSTNSVFIVDKDRYQRGRLDDRTKKEIEEKKPSYPLYGYDCIAVSELKNKLAAEDMRVLFKEYRDKRTGKFEGSTTRRADDLKN
ncbi:hypothetical protein DFQ05_1337 [Winogradskyella wandonensis]|uniref:Uncharacterized protein n=1 Tax=Winogradskyella wandonensis TaxID=1442586 RepID=A0A4R1KTL1_9FLAO|nr:hypothetical protein DFQ05_1337 [Winogradskyella wandonensis]